MKTYTLSELEVADDQKTITIIEIEESTSITKTSVAQLKEQYTQKLEQIEAQKVEADKIVDEIIAIDADAGIAITVSDIPAKLK